MNCVPPPLVNTISPVEPSSSGSSVIVLCSPSTAISAATVVPRMPIEPTGVVTTIAWSPDLAISPETNTNTPWTTETAELPVFVDRS